MKPVIGMIISEEPPLLRDKYIANSPYLRSLAAAGALPLLIPVSADPGDALAYADRIDGLLVPGGLDVAPHLFGEEPVRSVRYVQEDRDRMEFGLIRACVQQEKPVFAVCRGMQVVNVCFGGTLWQDIPSQLPDAVCHAQDMSIRSELTHTVTIEEDTVLSSLLGPGERRVNSYHHQAVRDVAEGFRVTAAAPDGVIEAMEDPARRILCVQWHPEELAFRYPSFLKLFRWLADGAAARMT